MAEMTGPGTGGTGVLSGLGPRAAATPRARVGKKRGFLDGVYLMQLVPTLLIVLIGVVNMWAASQAIEEASFKSHVLGIVLGLLAGFLVWRYDLRALAGLTTPLFVLACVFMVMPHLPFIGVEANGMKGWVQIPFTSFRFQPSEPGKIVMIVLMAAAAGQYNGKIETFKDYVRLCGTLAVPVGLMMVTDLGTSLVMFVSGAFVISCSGAPRKWVLWTWALVAAAMAFVVWESQQAWIPSALHVLKEYQLKRLLVFSDHSLDPTGDGYNLQQAMIAVGSGGFFGKGLGNASQGLAGFLPEAQTDFIFALFAEQFGFVGSVVLLGLFCWMIVSTLLLALKTDSMYGKLLLVGVAAMWTFQVVEEVGMCIGIMPITGIPLPFVSYGSSSMVVQLAAVGIVQSVYRHRQKSA